MDERSLVYDWNVLDGFDWSAVHVDLNDETLRDGLQSPSALDPPIATKIQFLHLMVDLGIAAANIGLPGAGPRAAASTLALAREIGDQRLAIIPNCAARTVVADIEPVVEISQQVGVSIDVDTFIGSSPIRLYAEGWSLDDMLRASEAAVSFAVAEGLPVMYVTEDTTRAAPDTLRTLYSNAIRWGARRLCLSDTVGHATPAGVMSLVRFIKETIIDPSGEPVQLDWHGHRDRGLGIANCLAAIQAGVDRVHGTALGVGERVGNAEMDLLIVNLHLLGAHRHDVSRLRDYCELAAESIGTPLPANYPVVGGDAFRTGTGVHAAAIIKAKQKGDAWLADRVYSSVPASAFGLQQRIDVSPLSGMSNVRYWLTMHGYDAEDDALCSRLLDAAKRADHVLSDDECHRVAVGGGDQQEA